LEASRQLHFKGLSQDHETIRNLIKDFYAIERKVLQKKAALAAAGFLGAPKSRCTQETGCS
jgi:hypothetical protein